MTQIKKLKAKAMGRPSETEAKKVSRGRRINADDADLKIKKLKRGVRQLISPCGDGFSRVL